MDGADEAANVTEEVQYTYGETIVIKPESLTRVVLDAACSLSLDSSVLAGVLARIVSALDDLSSKVSRLQFESTGIFRTAYALTEDTQDLKRRLQECEQASRGLTLQVERMSPTSSRAPSPSQLAPQPRNRRTSGTPDMSRIIEEVGRLVDAWMGENGKHLQNDLHQLADRLSELESRKFVTSDELSVRLLMIHDQEKAIKGELDALRKHQTELQFTKANKSELDALERRIEADTEERIGTIAHNEASSNGEKLDTCLKDIEANKSRTQELWRGLRDECQELREWSSKYLSELRDLVLEKMDGKEVQGQLEEMRGEVRNSVSHQIEALSKVEGVLKQKADVGDVVRLRDEMLDVRISTSSRRQLLIGTKCIACDRPVDPAEVTDQGHVDLIKARQQDFLFNEMEHLLSDPALQSGEKEVKLVAVRVNSPNRVRGTDGHEYEARAPANATSGGYNTARTPAPPRLVAATGVPASQPLRAPPREAPPLVRIQPRQHARSVSAQPKGSMREALGS